MATRNGRPRRGAAPPAPPESDKTDPAAESARALDSLIRQFGGGEYTVGLERAAARSTRGWEYLGRIPLTTDLLDDVKAEYGGGTYRGRVFDGANSYRGMVPQFTIAGLPHDPPARLGEALPVPDYIARLEKRFEDLAQRVANPPADPMQQVQGLLTVLAPIIGKANGSKDATDPVALLGLIQAAEQRGEARGRELGELIANGGPKSDGLGEVAAKYLPAFLSIVQREQSARTLPVATAPAPAGVPVSSPLAENPPMIVPDGFAWLAELRPFLPYLAKEAAAGHDARVLAQFVVDRMTDELADKIAAVATREDFGAVIAGALPALASAHGAWLAEFVEEVRLSVLSDEEGEAAHG